MAKNNVWKWTAKDKNGKPVESSPGTFGFMSRGPESEAEMRKAGQQLLNAKMQLEWYEAGQVPDWKSPGYIVDTIEPAGSSDQTTNSVGMWSPPGAVPVSLPTPAIPESSIPTP